MYLLSVTEKLEISVLVASVTNQKYEKYERSTRHSIILCN
jgi:hypothetical protein